MFWSKVNHLVFPTWVIIPVKALSQAKSRLKPVLRNDDVRQQLVLEMFNRVCTAAVGAQRISNILVITADKFIYRTARHRQFETILSPKTLNPAVTEAFHHAKQHGAKRVLILPLDIPFVTANTLDQMLAHETDIVLAPDSAQQGTNGLCLHTHVDHFKFKFGVGSFGRHIKEAIDKNLSVQLFYHENLAIDIDTPRDYWRYIASAETQPKEEISLITSPLIHAQYADDFH